MMFVKYITGEPEKCEVGEPSRVRKWSPPMNRFNNPPSTTKHSEARRLRARAKQKKAQR